MLVKFNRRGKGSGSAPVNYLLGAKRDRVGARVLQGNPFLTEKLIDATDFAQRYTSGTLSFEESPDQFTEEQKKDIIQKFETTIFTGLESDQFNILWVEHIDKGRLELNFLIPNMELRSGKRLQPYFHGADKRRVNAFQNVINYEYKLTDPHDPAKKRTFNPYSNGSEKAPIPFNNKRLSDIDNTKELRAEINRRLNAEHELNQERDRREWLIRSRKGVIQWLEDNDLKIERVTKKSISVSSPNPHITRNIRLTGALFEEKYQAHRLIAEQQYDETGVSEYDYNQSLKDWNDGIELKKQYHLERYNTPEPPKMPLNDVLEREQYDSSYEHEKGAQIANKERQNRPKLF